MHGACASWMSSFGSSEDMADVSVWRRWDTGELPCEASWRGLQAAAARPLEQVVVRTLDLAA